MAPRTQAATRPEFITVRKIVGSEGRNQPNRYNDSDEDVVTPGNPVEPCDIATDTIRCFYPRKRNAPGVRITFKDGGGFAVDHTMEQLRTALGTAPPVVPGLAEAAAPVAETATENTAATVN